MDSICILICSALDSLNLAYQIAVANISLCEGAAFTQSSFVINVTSVF